jgi:hypothetical protein
MNIKTQIAKFDQSIEDFVHCVASLNKELFLKRFNHWPTRDVVAHLIDWNRYTIEGGNQIKRGELPFYEIDRGEDCCKVDAVLILAYSSTARQEMLDELKVSAQESKEFLRSLDFIVWSGDYGVQLKGAVTTIQNTVDELIEDYDIHTEWIKGWVRSGSSRGKRKV